MFQLSSLVSLCLCTDWLAQRTILASGEVVQTLCVAACVVLWGGCQIAGYEVPVRLLQTPFTIAQSLCTCK